MDFAEAATRRGLDVAKEIRNLNRRLRHRLQAPGAARIIPGVTDNAMSYYREDAAADATQIEEADSPIAEYIRIFELRNHLVRS